MSRTSSFFILGGQLASSGGQTLFSDSLKLQLYQHKGQLNLLKVEVYLKPPHLNIALWAKVVLLRFEKSSDEPAYLQSLAACYG